MTAAIFLILGLWNGRMATRAEKNRVWWLAIYLAFASAAALVLFYRDITGTLTINF